MLGSRPIELLRSFRAVAASDAGERYSWDSDGKSKEGKRSKRMEARYSGPFRGSVVLDLPVLSLRFSSASLGNKVFYSLFFFVQLKGLSCWK